MLPAANLEQPGEENVDIQEAIDTLLDNSANMENQVEGKLKRKKN